MANISQKLGIVSILLAATLVSPTLSCGTGPPCPISNGFQKECVCVVVWGCSCHCPVSADTLLGGICVARPTEVGGVCRTKDSCAMIPGSYCNEETAIKRCECKETLVPTNNGKACISQPVALNEPCSDAAPCSAIPGSECAKLSETNYECKCQDPLRPAWDNRSCLKRPTIVGDTCWRENPCEDIPAAICKSRNFETEEGATCECPSYGFAPGLDSKKCQPTKLGVRCSDESTCDYIGGATCQGSPKEIARCLCAEGTSPQFWLTSCA